MAWAGIAPARAGFLKPELASRLTRMTAIEEVAVIITLSDQLDPATVTGPSRALQRANMKMALQDKAVKTQRNLLRNLRAMNAGKIVSFWVFNGVAATVPAALVPELARMPEVFSVQLDGTITLPQPVAATAGPEWNISAIGAPVLWDLGYTGGGVVVAGMDTGVDAAHQDLQGRWRGGGNSWFDPYGQHLTPFDADGHGTRTMGIMVGGSAGGTAVGVAPGATWIAVKIFNDQGQASYSAIHQGFQWLLDPDNDPQTDDLPDVVNNSWGFDSLSNQCQAEFQTDVRALRAAGIAVVFSAGNTGPGSATSISPANYPESFAVGAVDDLDMAADFSARGPTPCGGTLFPDVVAPGVNLRTSDLTFGVTPDAYAYISGTSAAAPMAAGAMALLRSVDSQLTVADLETALTQSARDLGVAGADYEYGHGMIDVVAAYTLVNSGQGLCTDRDGDGYALEPACPGEPDCNDTDPLIYPGAAEVVRDGVDQDCNNYDLTIEITRSEFRTVRDGVVIWATSSLGANALMQMDVPGIGTVPMRWNPSRLLWRGIVRDAPAGGFAPNTGAMVTVHGPEGVVSALINNR